MILGHKTHAIWKRGPAQLETPKVTSPRRLTVVPSNSSRSKVEPAVTVNELMLMVVHSTAAATSERLEMVPVHRLAAGEAGRAEALRARKVARRSDARVEYMIKVSSDERLRWKGFVLD